MVTVIFIWVFDLRIVCPIFLSNRRANVDRPYYTYGVDRKHKVYQWDMELYERQQRKDLKACVRTAGKESGPVCQNFDRVYREDGA